MLEQFCTGDPPCKRKEGDVGVNLSRVLVRADGRVRGEGDVIVRALRRRIMCGIHLFVNLSVRALRLLHPCLWSILPQCLGKLGWLV